MMLQTLQKNLESECKLTLDPPVLVGVSGGPDSVCLLDVLIQFGYRVLVAHFDHQLRPESKHDAEFVRTLAELQDLPFLSGRGSVAAYATEKGLSIEAAGRALRYRFLFEQAEAHQAQAVAVGHTADDQVETVLLHFLRGAGLRGLRGMTFRRRMPQFHPELPLVRPLLSFWHEDVVAYCEVKGLQWRDDPTNQALNFRRNRIRHELIPFLESYNPRIKEAVLRMAGIMAEELVVVETVLDQHWDEVLAEADGARVGFRRNIWNQLPSGVQRGLLLRAFRSFFAAWVELEFKTIRRAQAFFSHPDHNGHSFLKEGLQLIRRPDLIWVMQAGAQVPGETWPAVAAVAAGMTLPVPGEVNMPGGWRLTAERDDEARGGLPGVEANLDDFQAWIAGDRCPGPFTIRARRPGDKIRPLGLEGRSQKISDLMINVKMPVEARAAWPLVEFAGEIIWVPGYHLGNEVRVRPDTQVLIRLSLTPN